MNAMTLAKTLAMILARPRPTRRPGTRTMTRLPGAVAPVAAALACLSASAAGLAQQTGTPASIIAAQLRTQGYACRTPVSATRDRQASRPNVTVWVLRCANASYRVRLVPDMAAQVTQLE